MNETTKEILANAKQHYEQKGALSNEQTCKVCGVADGLNFTVSDEEWKAIVNSKLQAKALCLKCFDKMAMNAQKQYTIIEIYFAGIKQGFKFVPEQKRLDRPDREKIAKGLYEYASRDIQEFIDEFKVDVPRKPREWKDKPEGSEGKEYWYKRADQILALFPDIEEAKKQIIDTLENDFRLAPNDDSYLRLLARDSLDYFITGKTAKERADEKYKQALQKLEEG